MIFTLYKLHVNCSTLRLFFFLFCFFVRVYAQELVLPQLSKTDLNYLAKLFFKRECGADPNKLVWWNKGEAFPSLGIGHFIWYPANVQKTYQETFPALVQFLVQNKAALPGWLKEKSPCPWKNKADLDADPRKQELMQLLQATADLQAAFIVDHFNKQLRAARNHLNSADIQKIAQLAASPSGMFALIDYAHFKGFGANKTEQYKGQGWGLFDVISLMKTATLKDFQESARALLTRRAQNAPEEKKEHEQRWLIGWINRVNQYSLDVI